MDEPWAAAAAKDAPASATQMGGPHARWQEAEDTTAKHAPGQALENHRGGPLLLLLTLRAAPRKRGELQPLDESPQGLHHGGGGSLASGTADETMRDETMRDNCFGNARDLIKVEEEEGASRSEKANI